MCFPSNFKKKIILFILFIILINSVSASIIGVSPGIVHFGKMLRSGYAEKPIIITTSAKDELIAHFEMEGEIQPGANP